MSWETNSTATVNVNVVNPDAYMNTNPKYGASSWSILGTAVSPQNFATIHNPTTSGKIVKVHEVHIHTDGTGVNLALSTRINLSRATAIPTGGTVIASVGFDTQYAAASAIMLGGNASDSGVATAITSTAGTTFSRIMLTRNATSVGNIDTSNHSLIYYPYDVTIRPGEALLVQSVTALAATNIVIVEFIWEEY